MVGSRIRSLRRAKGMTLKELGLMVGVAESTMSLYEAEKRQPDLRTIRLIAEHLGTSVDYLLSGRADTPLSADAEKKDFDDGDLKFALWGDTEITEEVLDEVRRFARFAQEQWDAQHKDKQE